MRLPAFLIATVLLLLSACGGSDDTRYATAVQVDATRTTRTTIGPAGGTVTTTAADGRRYTLTIPAGALAIATEISATPITSLGDSPLARGLRGGVRFAPEGLKFAAPAILRIEGLSAGGRLTGFLRSDDGSRTQLRPAQLSAGTAELLVQHFSDAGASEATADELALVPPATPNDVIDEIWDVVARTSPNEPAGVFTGRQAVLMAVFDQRVAPLLAAQEQGLKDDFEIAIAAAMGWRRAVELMINPDASETQAPLAAGLGGRYERARTRAAGLLQTLRDEGFVEVCDEAGLHQLGLQQALQAHLLAARWLLADAEFALDATTIARRANDCVRVVFVPGTLPTFSSGQAVSLDQQARLVFAATPQQEVSGAFEFTVSATDATVATPTGFSDADGRYTTVVTPSSADASFDVQACVVVATPDGALRPTPLCARQTVPETGNILAGTVKMFLSGAQYGEVSLRLRQNDGANFSAVEVRGSAHDEVFLANQVCFTSTGRRVTATLASRTDYTFTAATVPFPTISLRGRFTLVRDIFASDGSCAVVSQTVEGDADELLLVTALVRDAAGTLVSIEVQSGGLPGGVLTKE